MHIAFMLIITKSTNYSDVFKVWSVHCPTHSTSCVAVEPQELTSPIRKPKTWHDPEPVSSTLYSRNFKQCYYVSPICFFF